jgi:hypothetical protein
MDWFDLAHDRDQWRALVNVGKLLTKTTQGNREMK